MYGKDLDLAIADTSLLVPTENVSANRSVGASGNLCCVNTPFDRRGAVFLFN